MPAFRALIAEAATRSLRHSAVVTITGWAVLLRWSDADALRRVLPLMNTDLEQLLAGGYVEPMTDARGALQLIAKGIEFLGERGAGLNEA